MALPRIPPGAHGRPGPHRVCGAGVAGQHVPARPSFQFLLKRPGTPGAAPPGTWADRRAHSWPFLSLHVPSFSPRLGGGNLCTPGDLTQVGGLGTPPAPGARRRGSSQRSRALPGRQGRGAGQAGSPVAGAAPSGLRGGGHSPTAPERRQRAALTSPLAPSLSPPPRPFPAPSPSSGLSRTATHTLWVHRCWVLGMALGVPQARAGCPRRPPAAPSTPAPGGLGGPSTAFSPTAPSLQPPRP